MQIVNKENEALPQMHTGACRYHKQKKDRAKDTWLNISISPVTKLSKYIPDSLSPTMAKTQNLPLAIPIFSY